MNVTGGCGGCGGSSGGSSGGACGCNMGFGDCLATAVKEKQSVAVVGIDPKLKSLPPMLQPKDNTPEKIADAFAAFGIGIIDAVYDLVPAVKPNIAFFETHGPAGIAAYNRICAHACDKGLLVIGDVKRGDIGTTAAAYAEGLLGGAIGPHDALTLNPYLGSDSINPFIETDPSAGFFILVKTSNPSSAELQDLKLENGLTLAQSTAALVDKLGQSSIGDSGLSNVGAVVGATHPDELADYRARMPHAPLLVPGYGAQGGSADDVVGAFCKDGTGAIVNASRSVIFAWSKEDQPDDWQGASRRAAQAMNDDLLGALRRAGSWA